MAEETEQKTKRREKARNEREYLRGEVERYRRAAEDAMQQLDWCIGYFHGSGKQKLAKSLSKNRSYIRTHLMDRSEMPDPSARQDSATKEKSS